MSQLWDVSQSAPFDPPAWSVINPVAGVDTLATIQADPTQSESNGAVAVATGYKVSGTSGMSTVVYVGFSVENLPTTGASTQASFLADIVSYVGSGL
jgi:hypothetical protein